MDPSMHHGSQNVLLIIDAQVDFHEGGSLAVTGATGDSERTAALIDGCGDMFDEIYMTFDTHSKRHIAHAVNWRNKAGERPAPFTSISHEQVLAGEWTAVASSEQPWLPEYAKWYTKQLEAGGRFKLTIWPEHCLMGSPGHSIHPALFAATQRWCERKQKDIVCVLKGQNPLTEMYSAIAAEVPLDDAAVTSLASAGFKAIHADHNTTLAGHSELVDSLTGTHVKRLVVCGQALSHCVNMTVRNLVAVVPEVSAKLVLLKDASSNVYGCDALGDSFTQSVVDGQGRVLTCALLQAELLAEAELGK